MMKDTGLYITFVLYVIGLFANVACTDDLKIKTDYEFTVEHLPVPKRLLKGETAEIRLELVRSGKYDGAKYYVRYFQTDGKGELRLDNRVLAPNDSYQIKKESFRMYYTSQCEVQQVIDLYFYDNFRNRVEVSFSFNNTSKDKDEDKNENENEE